MAFLFIWRRTIRCDGGSWLTSWPSPLKDLGPDSATASLNPAVMPHPIPWSLLCHFWTLTVTSSFWVCVKKKNLQKKNKVFFHFFFPENISLVYKTRKEKSLPIPLSWSVSGHLLIYRGKNPLSQQCKIYIALLLSMFITSFFET